MGTVPLPLPDPGHPMVVAAVAALNAWPIELDRERAHRTLQSWRYYPEMTALQLDAVLALFPHEVTR